MNAQTATKTIGYIGNDVPVALILAADALPMRLRADAHVRIEQANRFVESAFSPELRAIVERWLAGELDFLHSVVFPRTDDSAQRVYYYLCELQRRGLCGGPRPLLYDVADIGRPSSVDYTRESTRRLARELGARETRLASALERVARREALLAEVRSRRAGEAPLPGSLAFAMERASACDWRESFDVATRSGLGTAKNLSNPRRVVLAGDPPPDDALHRAIESAGGTVVLELTESAPAALPTPCAHLDAIADHFYMRRNPVREMRIDRAWIANYARQVRADAVVLWLIEEDEALPWEIARQVRSLHAAAIPTLLLSRQPWRASDSALAQVKEFIAALEVTR